MSSRKSVKIAPSNNKKFTKEEEIKYLKKLVKEKECELIFGTYNGVLPNVEKPNKEDIEGYNRYLRHLLMECEYELILRECEVVSEVDKLKKTIKSLKAKIDEKDKLISKYANTPKLEESNNPSKGEGRKPKTEKVGKSKDKVTTTKYTANTVRHTSLGDREARMSINRERIYSLDGSNLKNKKVTLIKGNVEFFVHLIDLVDELSLSHKRVPWSEAVNILLHDSRYKSVTLSYLDNIKRGKITSINLSRWYSYVLEVFEEDSNKKGKLSSI